MYITYNMYKSSKNGAYFHIEWCQEYVQRMVTRIARQNMFNEWGWQYVFVDINMYNSCQKYVDRCQKYVQ